MFFYSYSENDSAEHIYREITIANYCFDLQFSYTVDRLVDLVTVY